VAFINTHFILSEATRLKTNHSKVIFLPDWRNGNPYQNLLADGVRSAGWIVDFANYPATVFPLLSLHRKHPTVAVFHLHWINDYLGRILWSGSRLKFSIRLFQMAADVLLVRLRGIKVVWTVHNRLSHESEHPAREIMARRLLARLVSRLIFHSHEARAEIQRLLAINLIHRSDVIPHGHYIGMYPTNPRREHQLRERFALKAEETVVLFFGNLRRYKGVSQLLQAFETVKHPHLRLLIAGNPFDQSIADELTTAAERDRRLGLYLGFIPEADVGPLYAISQIAVVPFERTLTSGSAILALSQGKALILPEEARIIGLPDLRGTVFFNRNNGLKAILNKLPDKSQLEDMGKINFEAAQELDWSKIGRKVVEIYAL